MPAIRAIPAARAKMIVADNVETPMAFDRIMIGGAFTTIGYSEKL
jgi:hypothetical protein